MVCVASLRNNGKTEMRPRAGKLLEPGKALLILKGPNGARLWFEKAGQVELVLDRPDRLDFNVSASKPGWLFVADTWYPGWRAWIDGQPAPILRADYLFQALTLEAGSHTITLQYRPETFYIGGLLSILVLVALIGYRIVDVQHKTKKISSNPAGVVVELEKLNGNHDHRV
jgi:hypothetical protein